MFTTEQDCRFWAARLKFVRQIIKDRRLNGGRNDLDRIAKNNYAQILVSGFTHLFNQRLNQRGQCI